MQGFKDDENYEIRFKTIDLLLKAGSNPNVTNAKTLMTCLHWAAFYPNDPKSVTSLLEAGAKINSFEDEGLTPLDLAGLKAKSEKKYDTLDILLEAAEKYIDKLYTTNFGESRIKELAIMPENENSENSTSVTMIKTEIDGYNEEKKFCLDILYWAAYRDKLELVKKVINFGISPFLKTVLHESPLVAGIIGNSVESVKYIYSLKYESIERVSYNIKEQGTIYL